MFRPPPNGSAPTVVDMTSSLSPLLVDAPADVRAVLADPRFGVPAAPVDDTPPGSLRWLRQSVPRFANGPVHARRRAAVEALLAAPELTPERLRKAARRRAREARPEDLPYVPVTTLAAVLGVAEPDLAPAAAATRLVAAAYQPGASEAAAAAADSGVATLLDLLPEPDPERAALLICLLVQACDATAGLVRAASAAATATATHDDRTTVDGLVANTLRREPPVRATRREALADATVGGCPVARGTMLQLDLAAAEPGLDPLPFGHGLRPCPAWAQALALAGGVLDILKLTKAGTA